MQKVTQVARVCEEIHSTPELQGGYNAVGFSQGEVQALRRIAGYVSSFDTEQ